MLFGVLALAVVLAQGASVVSFLLGCVVPGVVVALLRDAFSRRYYAARGISC